jgi:hypothetical protein
MKKMEEIIREIAENQQGIGANFLGIKEYTSKTSGEVANFVVNFGISYANAKEQTNKILNTLTDKDFEAIAEKYGVWNVAGIQYATNKGAEMYLSEGKLPKEGTKARETALKGVKESKMLKTIVAEMIVAMNNNDSDETRSNQSQANIDAYNHLGRGIKQHKETKMYYFYANSHAKTVLVEGEYKDSTSLPETAQKRAISRYCKDVLNTQLPIDKFRQFAVSAEQMTEVNVTGDTYQIK